MNAVNALFREQAEDLYTASQRQADAWATEAEPAIRAYLAFGDMLDQLAGKFNGWKPEGHAERFMAECHRALCKAHGEMRRNIEDYREDAIDRAQPQHNCWPYISDAEEEAAWELADALAAGTVTADAAIRAVERAL